MFGIEADKSNKKLINKAKNNNMKLIKLASLALAAAGIIGVYNAGAASIGTTTNSTPLSVAITVVTNGASKTSGNTTSNPVNKVKITQQTLLKIFQSWSIAASNPFALTGAKIVIGWDQPWGGDVLVVDKTGTNVLFDASASNDPYFEAEFDDESGAYSDKEVDADPGSETYTEYYGSYYELYDDVVLPETELYGEGGGGVVTFTQKWDKNDNYSGWTLKATGMFPLYGGQTVPGYDGDASASASIKTSGSGKGENTYWY